MNKQSKSKTVELARSTYQPTKAELNEEYKINAPRDTPLEQMKALT